MKCVVVSQGGTSFNIVAQVLSKYLGCEYQVWDYNAMTNVDNVIIVGNLCPKLTMASLFYRRANQIWYVVQEGVSIYTPARIIARDVVPYIITPSRFSRKNIEFSGLWVDKIVPHALRFDPISPTNSMLSRKKYRYLYIGFYDIRKYPPFSRDLIRLTGSSLTIVTSSNNPFVTEKNRVIYNDKPLSDEEILRLYRQHKFYLNLSTLEGFCIPLIESMSQGTIPIVPDTEPFNEICTPETCWFYNVEDVVEVTHNYQIMIMPKYNPYDVYNVIGYLDYDFNMARRCIVRSLEYLPSKVYSSIKEFFK